MTDEVEDLTDAELIEALSKPMTPAALESFFKALNEICSSVMRKPEPSAPRDVCVAEMEHG